jgi:hypothetical protein
MMAALSANEQEAIACWLKPCARDHIRDPYIPLEVLADASVTARQTLIECVDALPALQQSDVKVRLLRFQPIAQHPPILQIDKPSQRLLIEVYRQQAAVEPEAFNRLIEISQYRHKEAALAASKDLDQVYLALRPTQIFALLRSPFSGVRANVVTALISLSRQPNSIAANDLSIACCSLLEENDQAVARLLCNLITVWVRRHQQLPSDVFMALAPIPKRLLARNLFEGGVARSLMDALKAIAQSEAREIKPTALVVQKTFHSLKVRRG